MKKSKRSKPKRANKKATRGAIATRGTRSPNPVVRFATRLGIAVKALEEIHVRVNPLNVHPFDSFVAKEFKAIAEIAQKALKESA